MKTELPYLGVGICFHPRVWTVLERYTSHVDFVEVITDDYTAFARKEREELRRLAEHFPLIAHGRNMAIGAATPLDKEYLGRVDQVLRLGRAKWFSEHLGFIPAGDRTHGYPSPLPFTADAVNIVRRNIEELRRYIDLPFLLENIALPSAIPPGEMGEAEFIARVVGESDCALLLDLSNVHANAVSHGFDARAFLEALPLERGGEVHVSGSTQRGASAGAHDAPVPPAVWELLAFVKARAPLKAVVVERDANFNLTEIVSDLTSARQLLEG